MPQVKGDGFTLRGPVDLAGRIVPWACNDCVGTRLPGIVFPAYDAEEYESCDGMVFVAKCDACLANQVSLETDAGYLNDFLAANEVYQVTGWSIKWARRTTGTEYRRPYFDVTLQQAKDFMEGR